MANWGQDTPVAGINSPHLRASVLRPTVVAAAAAAVAVAAAAAVVVVVVVEVAAAVAVAVVVAAAADVGIAFAATSHCSFQLAVIVAGDGVEPVEWEALEESCWGR